MTGRIIMSAYYVGGGELLNIMVMFMHTSDQTSFSLANVIVAACLTMNTVYDIG